MDEKEQVAAFLCNKYIEKEYTHSYIFGHKVGKIIYAARVLNADSLIPFISYIDRASSKNGGTYSLKYRPNCEQWAMIVSQAIEIKAVCTADYMENLKANTKMNRGQLFEKIVEKVFGGELETKSNLKFTEGGDIKLNGIAYQIKFDKATFTDEKTLMNLRG